MPFGQSDRDAYMFWLLTPDVERVQLKLASSKAEYARTHGMSTRTLSRWEERDDFRRRMAGEKARREVEGEPSRAAIRAAVGGGDAEVEPVNPASWMPVEGVDEQDFARLKSALFEKAAGGELRAIELAIKFFGEGWLEQEEASGGVLGEMSDVELAAGVLARLEAVEVEQALTLAGHGGEG